MLWPEPSIGTHFQPMMVDAERALVVRVYPRFKNIVTVAEPLNQ